MDYYTPKNDYTNSSSIESDVFSMDSLRPLINFLIKNLIWIILAAILCGVVSFIVAQYVLDKQYVSTIKVYAAVDNAEQDIESANAEFTYTKSVIETYTNILNSMDYYNTVSAKLENKVSPTSIKKCVKFASIANTNLFTVKVETRSSEASYLIADAISKTAFDTIHAIDEHSILKTVESPIKASKPSSPNVTILTLFGFCAGGLIGVIICFLYAAFDIKVRSSSDLQRKYNIPVLAEIPNFK